MKFSDFSNEKYRLNSFSVRIKYQPTVPNFLDSSLNDVSSRLTAIIIKRTYSLTSNENGICYIPEITGYTIFNVVNKSAEWMYVRPYYDFRCFFVIQAKSGEILINSTFEYSVYYLKET